MACAYAIIPCSTNNLQAQLKRTQYSMESIYTRKLAEQRSTFLCNEGGPGTPMAIS